MAIIGTREGKWNATLRVRGGATTHVCICVHVHRPEKGRHLRQAEEEKGDTQRQKEEKKTKKEDQHGQVK